MDLTSHPPNQPSPALADARSPANITGDACPDCPGTRTAGHVCKGGGNR